MSVKMSSRTRVFMFLILLSLKICSSSGLTNTSDTNALQSLKSKLTGQFPESWRGFDPCESKWDGITCNNNSRVTEISFGNFNLKGKFPDDVLALSELEKLDLASNPNLTGPLPPDIGNLKKLTILQLMGCNFSGQIPESIGNLLQLTSLSLNSNKFNGTIPASIGRLSKLDWFDITDNQIGGSIPISSETSPGLDMLLQIKHFHFAKNMLSGDIPERLFSANMTSLKHVLFDGNQFTGKIPNSLSLVKTLQVVRLDRNRLIGEVPSNLNNLTNLHELYLANNIFTGSLPNLNNLTKLFTLDVSNNRFTSSLILPWISLLPPSLNTLRMEGINLEGPIPISLFSPTLQTLILKRNWINETLNFGTDMSTNLAFVDFQYNKITDYKQPANNVSGIVVILAENPVCPEVGIRPGAYCTVVKQNSPIIYPNGRVCSTICGGDRKPRPTTCRCAYPANGTFTFRSPSFSDYLQDHSENFRILFDSLYSSFVGNYSVESVAISNIREDETDHYLQVDLLIFPDIDSFNWTGMSTIMSKFSTQTYKPPDVFGPYVFFAAQYSFPGDSKSAITSIIIGVVVGAVVLLLLLTIGLYALRQKRRAERAKDQIDPFAKWDASKSNVDAPQLMGAKAFTFEEMRKYADNFSEANAIGGGGYGQVYKGTLPSGQLIAIKRAQPGSLQGGLEFKTEIELLSRVHHKNVVRLIGFCFDRGEQMLVYEYIPNGSLRDSLSGKNGIKLDWSRRLRIALGSGKGLAYLHECADPPIIHRDIKSMNILLDESLNAKVADFGLSKLIGEVEKPNVTTQVKGTMGYLDPEYYMTNQLTEKSDVYGFGVVMFELLTGDIPIRNGKYVVKEVKMKMNKSKKLYDLQELLDTTISTSNENLRGFENYVDLALRCVEHDGVNRPSMSEVVKEIEDIMHHAGLNPNVDPATSSRTYEEESKGFGDLYGNKSFEYSATFPTTNLEPQ